MSSSSHTGSHPGGVLTPFFRGQNTHTLKMLSYTKILLFSGDRNEKGKGGPLDVVVGGSKPVGFKACTERVRYDQSRHAQRGEG